MVAIAAGFYHSLALCDDGSVVAWGRNWHGQAAVPSQATIVIAISAGWAHSVALRADGTVVAWGNEEYGQSEDSFLATEVIAIASGYNNIVFGRKLRFWIQTAIRGARCAMTRACAGPDKPARRLGPLKWPAGRHSATTLPLHWPAFLLRNPPFQAAARSVPSRWRARSRAPILCRL